MKAFKSKRPKSKASVKKTAFVTFLHFDILASINWITLLDSRLMYYDKNEKFFSDLESGGFNVPKLASVSSYTSGWKGCSSPVPSLHRDWLCNCNAERNRDVRVQCSRRKVVGSPRWVSRPTGFQRLRGNYLEDRALPAK